MIKTKLLVVFKYFSKCDATQYFVCQVKLSKGICNAKIGEKTFNLKKHLERNHPEIYKEVNAQDRQNNNAGSKNLYEKKSRNSKETIAKFFPNEKVTISMIKDKFKQHIIEMVVENGILLTFFPQKDF